MTLLFLFTLVLPVFAIEIETGQEPANDAAQVFIDAVNALDRNAIISASNAWGLASQAWQNDPENEELAAALDEAIAAQDAATQPMYDVFDLYAELTEGEQNREDVQTAYTALCSLYTAMCSAMDNPVAPGTGTDDPPKDALSVLYGDLPDAPTGSYMGSAGLPIATGETKISISGWTEDLSASGYLNAEALNSDSLTLTASLEDGEDFAIVPILTQVEYPANNSSSYLTLPEDVTLLGYDFTPAEDSSRLLEQTYTETSAAVSGIYVKSDHDFTALFTYVAGDGTRLEKMLNVEVREDADTIPTLYPTNSAATYSRPTPSVTSGKITSIQQVSGTWLIWFNGEDAYCCDNGKNGRPAGCPTYHYTHTSTVDATQYVPGDHYGNQMRIWGGLDQLSMGLLTVRESDDFSEEFCARNSSTYSASDAVVLEYAARIYNEQQLYIIEHYPSSQAAQIYLSSARAAMGLSSGAATYDVAGYYTYIYDSGDSSWQRVALVGESFSEGEDEGGEEGPPPTYDASWSVDVTESASASFSASMTIKVDKTANISHERLNDAEITISGNPANGSLDGGSWSLTPSLQVIRTVNGDGSVTFTYSGSVTKSASRSASGSVTGKSSQSEADSEAASQRAAAESSLRSEARADAQHRANAIANAAAQQARTFLVRETGVPHGFDATASSEQSQTVQPNGSVTAAIYNEPWKCSVRWEKLDSITGGRLTEDTEFTFYEWNANFNSYEVSPNYRVVRLADGTYTVRCINQNYTDWQEGFVYYTQTNLGRFKVMETTAAYGYNFNPWSVEFTISRQNDTAHYLGSNADRNRPWGNKLILHKIDSETGNEIASEAVFSLYEWNAQRGLYEISTNYAIVRDADGAYTVKCLHTDWTQAQYGNLYFEDTLCDTRQDTANHDGTASAHPVYYTDYDMTGYPNSRAFTNDGQFLVVEHKAPSGYYGDWTDIENPGTAGTDLGKRAYYIRLTGDGSTITLGNADYNADILTENAGGILVETADGIVTVQISPTAKPAERTYITDPTGLAANEDSYTMQPKDGVFQNDRTLGEIVLSKTDLDAAKYLASGSHGTATLDGAVYDLYCAEDIQHPDGVTGVVDYSQITRNGSPLWHTTILTNSGWKSNHLPVLKKDNLVASAAIQNSKLVFANLYPGRYYVVERGTGVKIPVDSDGQYYVSGSYPLLNARLERTGRTAHLTQQDGKYTDYVYLNQYSTVAQSRALDGTKTYDGYYLSYGTGYLCDETNHYRTILYGTESRYIYRNEDTSQDEVLKSGFELNKVISTTGPGSPAPKVEGAGFTVYLIRDLSKAGQFRVNPDGTYDAQSILDAYRKDRYDNETLKYDFTGEEQAVARMYESSAAVDAYNATLTADGDYANGKGYGWQPARDANEYRMGEIFTNEDGKFRVQGLPYGQYLVVETTVPKNVFQADPFVVTVDSKAPQSVFCTSYGAVTTASNSCMSFHVLDEELEGYLQLIKTDVETGKPVKLADTAFSLYRIAENGRADLVEMTDPQSGSATAKTSVFYTDRNGLLKTPEKLPLGRYRLVEVQGPEGYYNDSAYCVEFEITSERVYQVIDNAYDDMDDYIVTERYFNHETLGQITIRKQGEVLTGYSDGQFTYTTENLAGAAFEIRAKGDIATPDRQGSFWYRDGDLVATVTTGRDGQIDSTAFAPNGTEAMYDFLSVSHDGAAGEVSITLPLGTYEIREITAPYGFTLSDLVYTVTLGWENQRNDLVLAQSITANGERKEYSIVNAKDTTAQQKEEQVLLFTNERVVPVPDAPGKLGVGILKKDRENDTMLAGAVYQLFTVDDIYDAHGNTLANAGDLLATSDATDEQGFAWFPVEVPMCGEQYAAGHTAPEDGVWTAAYNSGKYTIVEVKSPAGYLLDSTPLNVSFTYPGQNVAYQVVNATNTNLRTTVHISKQDITNGAELPGAELVITDENGTEIEKWISTDVPYTIRGLELEKEYTLTEHQAPTGYAIAESITFKLTQNGNDQRNEVFYKDETGEGQILSNQTVVMQDDIIKVDISKTDIVTGEELPGATLQIYDSESQLVEQWVSTDTPHRIDRLPAGSYTLLELTAPEGYGIAEKVSFEVLPTSEIQTVTMKDAPALYIHKTDVGGKELLGAVLSVLDSDGNRIQQWTSTSQPKQLPVTGPDDTLSGGIMLSDETTERVYTLHEDAAPAGYQLAQDIQFKVLRTPENKLTVYYRANPNEPWQFVDGAHLTMVDELLPPAPVSDPEEPQPTPEPTPVPTPAPTPVDRRIPQTLDDFPLAGLLVLMGVCGIGFVAVMIYRKRKK